MLTLGDANIVRPPGGNQARRTHGGRAMNTHGAVSFPLLHTSSGLKAWWLCTLRGYHVVEVRRRPKLGMLGGIKYDSVWFIEPDEPSN